MRYTARVDSLTCISAGHCVAAAPAAFRFDSRRLGEATRAVDELDPELLLRVARECPSGAITVWDADGNEVDPFQSAPPTSP
jgi:ferredoxin